MEVVNLFSARFLSISVRNIEHAGSKQPGNQACWNDLVSALQSWISEACVIMEQFINLVYRGPAINKKRKRKKTTDGPGRLVGVEGIRRKQEDNHYEI